MALKFALPFPIFAPQKLNSNPQLPHLGATRHRPPTEIRFSRWNNANAERFNERRRAQQEIENDIRRGRRFDSATRIAQIDDPAAAQPSSEATFKSAGTPSSPSSPSIPGRKSKYSKPHPAFKKISRVQKTQIDGGTDTDNQAPVDRTASVALTDDGVSYIIDGAPFEFKYSYTETPKVKPLRLREAPYAPFGPTTMGRPWTGRAPLPPSKKKLKEFDSFKLPPPGKKGVKPVQAPGPYLPGRGPRYVRSREEILGEPLSKEEVKELIRGCMKSQRQMNLGRDGLTHNMLENIHAHWKRRRVCKIKCKGVCTVDMDNVKQQLEERTGGKIIYSNGGVIYLFRGRNYNYRTRPRFPLMLWRPVTPVYPRLIKRVPEGLTLEEATEMRKKGRKLIPICKLAKNGVYCDLVKNVQEAFEECELVRINCQGLNGSDYRKIGAKLKDLVPCVLISFENEHILMWRGRDWKSSLPMSEHDSEDNGVSSSAQLTSIENEEVETLKADSVPAISRDLDLEGNEVLSSDQLTSVENEKVESSEADSVPAICRDVDLGDSEQKFSFEYSTAEEETASDNSVFDRNESGDVRNINAATTLSDISDISEDGSYAEKGDNVPEIASSDSEEGKTLERPEKPVDTTEATRELERVVSPSTEGVMLLVRKAIENGSALILKESPLDADIVHKRVVSFAKTAPAGPVFRHRPKRVAVKKADTDEGEVNPSVINETETASEDKRKNQRKDSKARKKNNFGEEQYSNVVPHGSLRVDELAKLLT
ncbi:CRS2-associated factor 1, chloroplastic [Punica granatum]|uniref:CRS2-associated factor 1, chloroplastic n=1 Tax=Punica granatum TaxID=22663 RepID=A0A218XH32_PUNGR|nr:CRS2-associated factor 1, chloroplastic [Punica granatum]OWM84525.1 hypothetical protein CDL15_Pgr000965 [Punica granatum]